MSAARDSLSSLGGLGTASAAERSAAIGRIMYLVLGRWADTAVFSSSGSSADTDTMDGNGSGGGSGGKRRTAATAPHRAAMTEGVRLLADLGGLSVIWAALRAQFELFWSEDPQQLRQGSLQEAQDDLMNLMTIVYVALVETLADPEPMAAVREKLLALGNEASDDKEGHSLVHFMLKATTRLRWDEAGHLPQTQIFLLFWKSILLAFGGMPEVEQAKREMAEMRPDSADADVKASNVITASPLDYHVFRQEIVSKYPAYVPPRPILPLEAESTTFLPPLPNQPMRSSAQSGIVSDGPNGAGIGSGGTSILHQPVHIATPAPSPPPSPGVGGKGGKKQNYQTNQNFPFLYPPLDASSNGVGGKGAAAQQDALVGRRWEGSDVPASILEAGALFSKRVRMTRATRQLWDEREAFLKYERGWDEGDDEDVDDFDLDELTLEERELIGKLDRPKKKQADKHQEPKIDCGPNPDLVSEATRKRLLAVEKFYVRVLPWPFVFLSKGPGLVVLIIYTGGCPSAAPVAGHRSAQISAC